MPSTSSSSERNPLLFLQSASQCVQSLTANILSHLPCSTLVPGQVASHSKITPPPSVSVVTVPVILSSSSSSSSFYSIGQSQNQNRALPSSSIRSFSSSVRVDGVGSNGKGGGGGGPAFVGQVFSMLDRSGNGLMAVTTHFDIPFIAKRSAACFQKTSPLPISATNPQILQHNEEGLNPFASDTNSSEGSRGGNVQSINQMNYHFPFGDWFSNPWLRLQGKHYKSKSHISNPRMISSDENDINQIPPNPLLPKITMVGVSMGEAGQMNRANLKKTMEDLTKELEQANLASGNCNKDKDPLFVANVGDYSSITRVNSA